MAVPEVCAILVAHASGGRLAEAMASLTGQTRPVALVLVRVGPVAIPPGAERLVSRIVDVAGNAGFGEAANAGVAACPADVGFVLLLHDDVELDPGVVEALVARASAEPDVAAVGAKLLEWDEPAILQEVGAAVDRLGVRRTGVEPHEVDHGQYDGVADVVVASAACLLVRRDALTARGGLDPGAWPLYDDVDLCWRLRASGARVVVEPTARVRHEAALSRGLRGDDAVFRPDELRAYRERGRLRFMLKSFQPVGVALVLPQVVAISLAGLVASVVGRRFSDVRMTVWAWSRVLRELPRIVEARRAAGERRVPDDEILRLGSRLVAPTRRLARVASIGRLSDGIRRTERRLGSLVASPVALAAVVASVAVVATLREVLFAGPFTVGELRPIPTFARAVSLWFRSVRPEGFDAYAAAAPGLVVAALPRLVPGVGAATAEKLLLLVPLAVAAAGGARLARVLGFGATGRAGLAVAGAVNPATLFLLREGLVGALVTWAASMWLASSLLRSDERSLVWPRRVRRGVRGALGWALVAALHPPGLVWLVALGVAVSVVAPDGRASARLRRVGAGVGAAFLVCLPWSTEWLSPSTPLLGRRPGFLPASTDMLQAATFGAGWPLVLAAAVVVLVLVATGASRLAPVLAVLGATVWAAGGVHVFPRPTALAGAGWCVVVLAAVASAGVRDALRRAALGRQQLLAVAGGALLGVAWLGGAGASVVDGTDAHAVPVDVPQDAGRGRVLWALPTAEGTLFWATGGFRAGPAEAWPIAAGRSERFVAGALAAARAGRTERLGALLALAGVSDVAVVEPRTSPNARGTPADPLLVRGLRAQADLAVADRQTGVVVYRNHAWAGRALVLSSAPGGPLTPGGVAAAALARPATFTADLRVQRPAGGGVVYVAEGARRGWRIDGGAARPAAAGAWTRVAATGGDVRLRPPPRWRSLLVPIQAICVLVLLGTWLVAAWVSSRDEDLDATAEEDEADDSDVPASAGMRLPVLAGALAAVGAAALAAAAGPAVRAGPLLSSLLICPAAGEGPTMRLAVANPAGRAVRYAVRPSVAAEPTTSATLGARSRATVDVDAKVGSIVESFGGRVAASAIVAAEGGGDTAACIPAARRLTYFAEGGRGAVDTEAGTVRTGFLIANPFPETAHVQLRLFTGDEAVAPPRFRDVAVEPGAARLVDPEEQLEPTSALGAEITVWQGRAIVARRMRRGTSVLLSTGTGVSASGVLPRASTTGARTALVALNPTDRPARVSIAATADTGSLAPLSFDVGPGSRERFVLEGPVADKGEILVRVASTPPVAIEAVVVPADRAAITVLPPATAARSWVISAAESRTLLLANAGSSAARVRLERLGPGMPIAPVTVRPGAMQVVALEGDEPFGLAVRSDRPVVAAVVGVPGSTTGVPG